MGKHVYKARKQYPDEWLEQLCSDVDEAIKKSLDDINLYLCANIALVTMNGITEYIIDHSMDPPYDYSGCIKEVGMIEESEFKKIHFSDFIKMYNGETNPSFCSGCGFFHEDYSEDVDRWLSDAAFSIQNKIIEKALIGICPELNDDTNALDDAVFDVRDEIDGDTLAYEAYSILSMLRVESEDWTLDTIRAEGIFLAKQVDKSRREYLEERQRLLEKLQEKADTVVLKPGIPKGNRKWSGKIPYITKDDKNVLAWLRDNYTTEEIELLIIGKKNHGIQFT